jgi:hypothetical protein
MSGAVVISTQSSTSAPGIPVTIVVSCPTGKYAIGGGGNTADQAAALLASYPPTGSTTSPATSWEVIYETGNGGTYTGYAICSA